jgi:hypothetical protein
MSDRARHLRNHQLNASWRRVSSRTHHLKER